MKEFVKDTIAEVMNDDSRNRFAAAVYSSDAQLVFNFKRLGDGAILSDYEPLIEGMPYLRGLTFIDKALTLGNSEIFSTAGGMRPQVAKVKYQI